jgi:hypothetical protein
VLSGLLGGIVFAAAADLAGITARLALLLAAPEAAGWVAFVASSIVFAVLFALANPPATWLRTTALAVVWSLALWVFFLLAAPDLAPGALVGHVLYGLVLGLAYHAMAPRTVAEVRLRHPRPRTGPARRRPGL